MRVFSVVFMFATFALFGVTARRVCNYEGCELECPRSYNDALVCNYYDNITYTSNVCESNKLVHCAMEEEGKVVTVTQGPCAAHTYTNCETTCGEGKEVCANLYGRLRKFHSYCDYLSVANCIEVERNDPTAHTSANYFEDPVPTYEILGYGNCAFYAEEY